MPARRPLKEIDLIQQQKHKISTNNVIAKLKTQPKLAGVASRSREHIQAKDGLTEKGREYRQQLAEEKERRERNQCKKAAQAAHSKKEPRSQKHSANDAISPNQSHWAPLPDVIRPRCDHQDHETNDDGDNDEYPPEKRTMRRRWRKMGPCRHVKQPWRFTAPRDFERAHLTQRQGSQHTIVASSPIPSSQRDRVTVPAGTATRSSPGPWGSSREKMGIAHPTLPHVSQHSIAAGSSISSSQRKVVPDPPSGFREATPITHRKSQHSIVASSSISSSQRQVVPDTLGAFRETTAITHRKSLVSLEDSSSEEVTNWLIRWSLD
ncbi:hypothetical protein JB92DRAFT_3137779 [Gautieria morchelliformis]|nr:hypothetical protein JB92DRAFT_3137779 [Gautieria morchelliformis]